MVGLRRRSPVTRRYAVLMLEAVRNAFAGRNYVVVSSALPYRLDGPGIIVDRDEAAEAALRRSPHFIRLSRAIDEAVDRTVSDLHGDTWHVIELSNAPARLVWPRASTRMTVRRASYPADRKAHSAATPSPSRRRRNPKTPNRCMRDGRAA